jgi:hypothetical protein
VLRSGRGVQAFYVLQEPATVEEVEARNQWLAVQLGCEDGTHNADRVMKLPGTIAWASSVKRAKGWPDVSGVARLLPHHGPRIALGAMPTPPEPREVAKPVALPTDLRLVQDMSELPAAVLDQTKTIIVQGLDPDEPNKHPSRSEWLWYVVCALVRAGCTDEMIAGVILNPDFKISESVLEKRNARKYAAKQIRDARSQPEDEPKKHDPVSWVNERYFAVMEGGKPAFYRDEAVLDAMTWQAFEFELAPFAIPGRRKLERTPFSKLWRASHQRRYYPRGFVLDPGREHPGTFNLWRGFGVEPRQGDWSRLRAHILLVLAAGDEDHADYIVRWIAWKLQNPAAVPRVALVFKGDEGTGKGALGNSLVRVFGAHGLRIQNMSHLVGKFNAHLRHCCLLFADEAVAPDQSGEGPLKGTISEPTVPIERKGYDVVKADNHIGVVMATNNDWAVPAGPGARRYAVFAVSPRRKGDVAYFTALFAEINGGGLEAMVYTCSSSTWAGGTPRRCGPTPRSCPATRRSPWTPSAACGSRSSRPAPCPAATASS